MVRVRSGISGLIQMFPVVGVFCTQIVSASMEKNNYKQDHKQAAGRLDVVHAANKCQR